MKMGGRRRGGFCARSFAFSDKTKSNSLAELMIQLLHLLHLLRLRYTIFAFKQKQDAQPAELQERTQWVQSKSVGVCCRRR